MTSKGHRSLEPIINSTGVVNRILIFCLTILFISCRLQIITQTRSYADSGKKIDSVIILDLSDRSKLPDSVYLVNWTKFKLPVMSTLDYYGLMDTVKEVATKKGCNVVKIISDKKKFSRFLLETQMFYLGKKSFEVFTSKIDSASKAYRDSIKNIALVHIRDYDDLGERTIHYNDSLVGKIRRVGFDSVRKPGQKDFTFGEAGILRFDEADSISITLGSENYIVLYTLFGKHTYHKKYKSVNADMYHHKDLLNSVMYGGL